MRRLLISSVVVSSGVQVFELRTSGALALKEGTLAFVEGLRPSEESVRGWFSPEYIGGGPPIYIDPVTGIPVDVDSIVRDTEPGALSSTLESLDAPSFSIPEGSFVPTLEKGGADQPHVRTFENIRKDEAPCQDAHSEGTCPSSTISVRRIPKSFSAPCLGTAQLDVPEDLSTPPSCETTEKTSPEVLPPSEDTAGTHESVKGAKSSSMEDAPQPAAEAPSGKKRRPKKKTPKSKIDVFDANKQPFASPESYLSSHIKSGLVSIPPNDDPLLPSLSTLKRREAFCEEEFVLNVLGDDITSEDKAKMKILDPLAGGSVALTGVRSQLNFAFRLNHEIVVPFFLAGGDLAKSRSTHFSGFIHTGALLFNVWDARIVKLLMANRDYETKERGEPVLSLGPAPQEGGGRRWGVEEGRGGGSRSNHRFSGFFVSSAVPRASLEILLRNMEKDVWLFLDSSSAAEREAWQAGQNAKLKSSPRLGKLPLQPTLGLGEFEAPLLLKSPSGNLKAALEVVKNVIQKTEEGGGGGVWILTRPSPKLIVQCQSMPFGKSEVVRVVHVGAYDKDSIDKALDAFSTRKSETYTSLC